MQPSNYYNYYCICTLLFLQVALNGLHGMSILLILTTILCGVVKQKEQLAQSRSVDESGLEPGSP